ncbi:MAG: HAD family hydrolase [Leptolyngbyaceae cyanobacterium SL_7_1]|nr:HAD family hydrolase [Leptolyngbyaceae cyanobacterium SL_7_1]
MPTPIPTILALDFDGVLCDGLVEYFQTAWRAYCQIWQPATSTPPQGLADRFYRARPVVETGWEMPVVIRSLLQGVGDDAILQDWKAIAQRQVAADGVNPADLARAVDGIRDQWIAEDLENWLSQHRFYPGVIERLRQTLSSPVHPIIITTKEGRFVHKLLQQQGIKLVDSQVLGKEIKQPKAATLHALLQTVEAESGSPPTIWFVEDRLKTLYTVKAEADLTNVGLFLADWGYNTKQERSQAQTDDRIYLLSLSQFAKDFFTWTVH